MPKGILFYLVRWACRPLIGSAGSTGSTGSIGSIGSMGWCGA